MTEPAPSPAIVPAAEPEPPAYAERARMKYFRFALRRGIPGWQAVLMGILGAAFWLALWWFVTLGEPEERIVPPSKGLMSPAETLETFPSLCFDRALTPNLLT